MTRKFGLLICYIWLMKLECVQRSFIKRLPGFANLTYAERLD